MAGYAVSALTVAFVIGVLLVRRARKAERRGHQQSGYTSRRPWWAGR